MMMKKIKPHLYQILNAVILAGMIIFLIGLYYWVVKAGIPYQDAPLELQIQYAVNLRIGDILAANGLKIAVCGGILRLLCRFLSRKNHLNPTKRKRMEGDR